MTLSVVIKMEISSVETHATTQMAPTFASRSRKSLLLYLCATTLKGLSTLAETLAMINSAKIFALTRASNRNWQTFAKSMKAPSEMII